MGAVLPSLANLIPQAKNDYARKLFAELSTEDLVYEYVNSYQKLLDVMQNL